MASECPECGGRTDRVGLYHCDEPPHPAPDLAERIVREIENDLNGRRGVGFDDVDEDTQYEIRAQWAEIVRREIAKP